MTTDAAELQRAVAEKLGIRWEPHLYGPDFSEPQGMMVLLNAMRERGWSWELHVDLPGRPCLAIARNDDTAMQHGATADNLPLAVLRAAAALEVD